MMCENTRVNPYLALQNGAKMGTDQIAEVVCLYCGKVMGKKAVSVPETFSPVGILATHGICDDCISMADSGLPGTEEEVKEKDIPKDG